MELVGRQANSCASTCVAYSERVTVKSSKSGIVAIAPPLGSAPAYAAESSELLHLRADSLSPSKAGEMRAQTSAWFEAFITRSLYCLICSLSQPCLSVLSDVPLALCLALARAAASSVGELAGLWSHEGPEDWYDTALLATGVCDSSGGELGSELPLRALGGVFL